ncbi:hypothetical protein PHSC3_000986 [Chlamydiales bacterium STE3]|nr:hypothetical protein PHSC3_000986 [Chlamydiales bacterium STE3]
MSSIFPSQLQAASIFYKGQQILLDGTESNFHEAIRKINPSAIIHNPDSYDSDDDFSEFQKEGFKAYIWRDSDPLPTACRTTISCPGGNVKGNVLLTRCRLYISEWLNNKCDPDKINELPGKYFASCAGKFAKLKTSLDCNQTFSPGDYEFGISKVKTRLTQEERLFIIDEDLQRWITKDLGLEVKRWDLPYRGYNDVIGIQEILKAIKEKVISYTAPQPRKVPDNELGTAQLYCAFPESYPIEDGPYLELLQQGALHKFLDYFNALIFGLEASRNNLVFLTGLLVLLDMRHGSYPSAGGKQKGSFFYDDLLDLFPMSVTGTGPGNFIAEKAMYIATQQLEVNKEKLDGQPALGFSIFRKNSQWLKVTLKSAIVVYNWLANQEIVYYASELPIRALARTTPILDTDDFITVAKEEEENQKISNNFFDDLGRALYEVLLHHYA